MRSRLVSALLLSATAVLVLSACGPRGGGVSPEVRRQYEITIFTDDPETGRRVLAAIEAMGYTHPENEVLDTPNDEYNIKWGGAPEDVIDEIQGIVEPMVHQELFPRHIFGPEDHDIFINLPVCKLGGAYTPETCGMAPMGAVDPQYDAQGIPQACGMARESADFGSIQLGTKVRLGQHRPVDGDANWVEDMQQYVGQTGTVTELFGTDGSGCPVVHVDVDNGDWYWRVRDMQLVGGGAVVRPTGGAIPTACGMTDETVQYGPVQVGSKIKLGRHTPWQGDANWAEDMTQYVGQEAKVTELAGTDAAGCALVKVDVDGGSWYWRLRDAAVVGAGQSSGFPQHCGQSDDAADYGAAQMGATVRLGRHREVNGDANWAEDMEAFVGQTGTVTEHLGTDSQGCPVIHVSTDSGAWAWRVRDLMAP